MKAEREQSRAVERLVPKTITEDEFVRILKDSCNLKTPLFGALNEWQSGAEELPFSDGAEEGWRWLRSQPSAVAVTIMLHVQHHQPPECADEAMALLDRYSIQLEHGDCTDYVRGFFTAVASETGEVAYIIAALSRQVGKKLGLA